MSTATPAPLKQYGNLTEMQSLLPGHRLLSLAGNPSLGLRFLVRTCQTGNAK